MRMKMTPGLWLLLVCCLGGISYQLVSGGEAEGGFFSGGADRARESARPFRFGEQDSAVVRSSRKREKSLRKSYFPFDSLSRDGSRLQSQAELFLKNDLEARRAFHERRKVVSRINAFGVLGLGIKHPEVEPFQARKEEFENTVILRWVEYRKRHPRGKARERKRAPGG